MLRRFNATGTSTWNLLLFGLAAGIIASPAARKGMRGLMVAGVKAVLATSDEIKSLGYKINEGFSNIMADARAQQAQAPSPVKEKLRAVGVTAVGTGLAAAGKVKGVTGDLKKKWGELVTEAKAHQNENSEKAVEDATTATENPAR
ncbi:MAG: hypothetical protein C4589_08275 [Peptococcaceae bacterium]|nr:MAG: hypothetical protein C4589_08275 [Peptococcaceae bacterium]